MKKRDVVLLKIEMGPVMAEKVFEYGVRVEGGVFGFLVEIVLGNAMIVEFLPSVWIRKQFVS